MACAWVPFTKLMQYVEKFFNPSKRTENISNKNQLISCHNFPTLKKTKFLIISPFCGIVHESKERELNAVEEVVHNVALAIIALKDGNFEKSKRVLMKTFELAETHNFFLGMISTCDMLSSLAVNLGDFEGAEDHLIRALDNLFRLGVSEDDDMVVNFFFKLFRIYSESGNDELAEFGFRNCLRMLKKNVGKCFDDKKFLLNTTILYWYGIFLLGKNRFKEAKSCLQDCYLISQKVDDLLPNQRMVILYSLGEVCQTLGELDDALEHLSQGITLNKKRRNPDLAYFCTKLGVILMRKGLYREAKVWCNRGKNVAVKYKNCKAEKESKKCLNELNHFFI